MGSLHDRIKRDLPYIIGAKSKSNDTAILVSPSCVEYSYEGTITYSQTRQDNDGNTIIVENPSITLQMSLLDVVPNAGEKWIIKIDQGNFKMEGKPLKNETMDTIVFSLKKLKQSQAV